MSFSVIKSFVKRAWKGIPTPGIHLYEKGYYVFRFAEESDRSKVLGESWFLNKQPLMLREWRLQFQFDLDAIESIPVWVRLMDLDLEFRGERIIDKLSGKVRHPIYFALTVLLESWLM